MIKSYTFVTYEEDPEEAAADVLEQLEDCELCANSVGLVSCCRDFIDCGTVAALQKSLPFPVAGEETMIQLANGEVDILMCSITVLTSDEATFTVAETPALSVSNESKDIIKRTLESVKKGDEKLIIAYPPFMPQFSADNYIDVAGEVLPGVPMLGSTATGQDLSSDLAKTPCVFGTKTIADNIASFVLVGGNVTPKFFIASGRFENMMTHSAIITKADDNVLIELNNKPALIYCREAGYFLEDMDMERIFLTSTMELAETKDTLPICRVMIAATPDNSIICAGRLYEGATFRMLTFDVDSIRGTTESLIEEAIDAGVKTLVGFSCVGRRLVLGGDPTSEFTAIADTLKKHGSDMNCAFAYSGSEYCPTHYENGVALNRMHNYTIVAVGF